MTNSASQRQITYDQLGKDERPSFTRSDNSRNRTTAGNGGGLHVRGATRPNPSGNVTSANDTPDGSGVLKSSAGQEGGGLWNSATGTMLRQGGGGIFNDGGTVNRQSSFYGQDQETGEIIDFRANFKNGRQAAGETHSVVDSEGWDEVPEHLMFGFRARNTNRNRFGFGPVRPNQVNSPRDAASGLPTGKRQ